MALNKSTSYYREMSHGRRRFEQEQHDRNQEQKRAEAGATKPRG